MKTKYRKLRINYEDFFIKLDTELLMIKELRTRGLVSRNIFVPFKNNNYKNGKFSEKDLKK